MGLNICNSVTNLMMKITSSSFICGDLDSFGSVVSTIVNRVFGMLSQLLYFVCKWLLYLVDIVYFYIMQLCGLEMDLSSLNSAVSKDSDMVFNLLLSNSRQTTTIVRALIGLALALIIVFTIVAIIKSQLTSLKDNKPTDVKGSVKTAFKALILILVTPMIAIVSIVASNVLLKALYNATNTTNANSLSSSIFSISASSANKYRAYALANKRIPITFDFSSQEDIMKYYEDNPISDKMGEYLTSSKNVIYTTAQMFGNEDFSYFDQTVGNEGYYLLYDNEIGADKNDPLFEYKRIRAYQEEYFVMADMVDYAVKSCNTLYIKTVERMLDSIISLPEDEGKELFNDVIATFGISLYRSDDLENEIINSAVASLYDVYYDGDFDVIRFSSFFYTADDEGEPIKAREIQYNHVSGKTNEAEGAVFIMTSERTITVDGTNYTYYYPVTLGSKDYGTTIFESEYIKKGSLVPAKGIFSEAGYPTAIKESYDGEELIFYRDNLEQIVVGDSGNVLNQGYKEEEPSEGGLKGIIKSISKFFSRLFNPAKLVPDVTISPDAIASSYMKTTSQVNKLNDGGKLHISYMYNDALSSAISGNVYGLKLYNLYEPMHLNFLILVMGSVILIKICFMSVFALIKRAYDLFLLIVMYPTACATMPIDGGAAYKNWTQKYFGKLLSTYGLILGINFVLMLFPVIESIEFFTHQDIAANKTIRRIGVLFFRVMSVNQITRMLNLFMAIMCELVAFTLLETIPNVISKIIGADDISADNPANQMVKVVGDVGMAVGKVTAAIMGFGEVFTLVTKKGRQRMKDKLSSKAEKMKKYLPMSSLVGATKDKVNLMKKKGAQNQAYKDLKETLDSSSADPKEVEAKLNAFINAQTAYSKALDNPTADRKTEADRKKQERKSGVSSRAQDETNSESNDATGKSSRELKNEYENAKKHVKYLNKKEKNHEQLSEEEQKAKETYQQIMDNAENEMSSRKGDKKDLKKYSKQVNKYQNKINGGGTLTEKENAEYQEAMKQVNEINARKEERKNARNNKVKNAYKDQVRAEAQEIKDLHLFRHTGGKRKQEKRMKQIDKGIADVESRIRNANINLGKDISTLSDDELAKVIQNPSAAGISNDQVAILQYYAQQKQYRNKLVSINQTEFANSARRTAERQAPKQKLTRDQRKENGIRKHAIRYLTSKGETITEDKIQQYVDNVKSARQKKKNKGK